MFRGLIAAALLAALANSASAQGVALPMRPGAYAAIYACPRAAPVPFDLYVFEDYELVSTARYVDQRGRIEVDGGVFVVSIRRYDANRGAITISDFERTPASGWDVAPRQIELQGAFEQMRGRTAIGYQYCAVQLRRGPTQRTVQAMNYANIDPRDNHSEHRGALPSDIPSFTPSAESARTMSAAVARAVADDSDSWLVNRFIANSVDDFHFFQRPDDPARIFVYAHFRYDGSVSNSDGHVVAEFRDGALRCMQFHDRSSCTRPRQSRAAQVASLGQGRPRLGPMSVAASCFGTRTRTEMRSRQVQVGYDPGPAGGPVYRTEYYGVPVQESFYQCTSQTFELECVAAGADRLTEAMIGSGTTRRHTLALNNGQATGLTPGVIAGYNSRIQAGTCVRTR